MVQRAGELIGLGIQATDSKIGKVQDLLFDDVSWGVRYLVVDTGNWLTGRRVLISPASVSMVHEDRVDVALSHRQIEGAPGIEVDEPVSRQYEEEMSQYWGWPAYWSGAGMWGVWGGGGFPLVGTLGSPAPGLAAPGMLTPTSDEPDGEASEGRRGDRRLRSMREVDGYSIHAADGEIGHVSDFLVDSQNWAVRYLVMSTRNWWPGKSALIPPQWIQEVSWDDATVYVSLAREEIQSAPEWKPGSPITREYEDSLFRHYGKPPYWNDDRLMHRWKTGSDSG